MTDLNVAANKAAERIGKAIDSLHGADKLIPLILAALLDRYGRHGLADLVRMAWNWRGRVNEDGQTDG